MARPATGLRSKREGTTLKLGVMDTTRLREFYALLRVRMSLGLPQTLHMNSDTLVQSVKIFSIVGTVQRVSGDRSQPLIGTLCAGGVSRRRWSKPERVALFIITDLGRGACSSSAA